jgi:ketosteroid isomerase-like protein
MDERDRHADSVRAYFAGINAERFDDVAALFAEDGELRAPGTEPLRGRDAIAGYFAAALAPYPDHFDDPVRTLFSGDSVTVEIHYTGRHTSGMPIEFDAVDVFDFDANDKIRKLTSWYDSYSVRAALRQISKSADARAG